MKIIHFGAGSLGLGLVLPFIREQSAELTIIDQNTELVAALSRSGKYRLQIYTDIEVEERPIRVERALDVADVNLVTKALQSADMITTSVRIDNLPTVATHLAHTFGAGDKHCPRVVACENVESSSTVLAKSVGAGIDWSRLFFDTEVDRICQSLWPDSLAVRTETYAEWIIESSEPFLDANKTGVKFVPDVTPYFDRKRFLVNTIADYIAFAGSMRGHRFLHEAASDPEILNTVQLISNELIAILQHQYEFTDTELTDFARHALKRLQQRWIMRRIETVARGHLTKLSAGERFAKPYCAYIDLFGKVPVGLKNAIETVIAAGRVDAEELTRLWSEAPSLIALIERQG